jgi:hypoxanthine phosphoribosyltransferase
VAEILIDEDRLSSRVQELGEEISADYAGRDLLLIGVLKGAVFFMADLMRTLTIPCCGTSSPASPPASRSARS